MLVHRKHNALFYKEENGSFQCDRKKCALCPHIKVGEKFKDTDGT